MKLPLPTLEYNKLAEQRRNGLIENADAQNHKRGRDVEIGLARLILTSPNGTRYEITVQNDGTIASSPV